MQKPQFTENQLYHICNRGVEKREIFLGDKDRLRFVHDLFEFNDEDPVPNLAYHFNPASKKLESQSVIEKERKPRKLLVEILLFALMPNHFHLFVRQKKEKGIVKFMQKLGTGYTNYFNKKYERVGSLFQGSFKAVLVAEEAHFIHLPFYIHANPLDLIYRSSTSIDWQDEAAFLKNYRWSSYLDYIGMQNFPSVTSRELLLKFWGDEKNYQKETEKWIKERYRNTEEIKEVTLE